MTLKYTLSEFHLHARYMKLSELENVIGEKLGIPSSVKKPEIEVIVRLKTKDKN